MKPILLFAFADDPDRPLNALEAERVAIREKLAAAVAEELCETEVIERADIDAVLEVFHRYPDRIAVFHFAGHAGSYELCLQRADGRPEIAHAGGFAEFLALQRGLQLVFLNGCSTQAQVEALLRARAGAVIATSQAISDEVATHFSGQFYRSLGAGDGIQKAFQEAAAAVKMKMGPAGQHRGIYYRRPTNEADRFPWDFYVSTGADVVREWNLPGAAGNPLFGLPKPPQRELPDTPFRYLYWFRPEDAEIFYGRAYQIRELYDKIADPHTPGVIHLYGRSGVGKSSLLAAGLLPRLQADHEVQYLRRSQETGCLPVLAAALGAGTTPPAIHAAWMAVEEAQDKPLTIILDQLEEIYTRPLKAPAEGQDGEAGPDSDELAALLAVAQRLYAPGSSIRGKLILSYRKEYLAEIESRFVQARVAYDKLFLENLQRNDILAAVTGLTRAPRTREKYGLQIEDGLPAIIADDLLEDRDSPIAPVLQILLSKMWDETELREEKRSFTIDTYQRLKREGLLLDDFLHQKLNELRTWNPRAVDSGLVLGLLLFHTTAKGTAARRSRAEIEARYPQHAALLPALLTELKNRYLLVEVAAPGSDERPGLSLAHDTLAPLLREMSLLSDYPAQKANRILTNKMADWESGDVVNALDAADLKAVEEGRWGMRAWTEEEQKLVAASRERRARARRTRRRVIAGGVAMLALIIGAAVVAWVFQGIAQANAERAGREARRANEQARLSTSNSLAANSVVEQDASPTTAFRLAEYALAYDSINPRAYSALLEAFYAEPYFFGGRWHGSPFFLEESREVAPPVYPDPEYVIYHRGPWESHSESDLENARARIAELIGGGNSWLFQESEFGNYSLQKAVLSPRKGYLLLALNSGSDFTVPQVEVWDLKNRDSRYGDEEPLIRKELNFTQVEADAFSPANFSFDDRYVALPQANGVLVTDLQPDRYSPEVRGITETKLSSSTAEVLRAYFGREGHRVGAVDARGETTTWDLSLNPLPSFAYSSQTDILTDSFGRFIVLAKGKEAEVWACSGERLGAGAVSADRRVLTEGPAGLANLPLLMLMKREWFEQPSEYIFGRDTSADGRLIITAEKYYEEYDYWGGGQVAYLLNAKGDTLLRLRGHSDLISSAAVSPDGRYFLTATCPKGKLPETKLWDAGGNVVLTLTGFGGKAGFLPSGHAIFTYLLRCCAECDYGQDIKVWPIDARRLIALADAAGAHHLDDAERVRYSIDTTFLPATVPEASAATAEEKEEATDRIRQAYITGSGVNVRSEARVGDNVVGQLNDGGPVEVLEVVTPEGTAETFVSRISTVLTFDDGREQSLGSGRALKRLETLDDGRRYRVEVEIDGLTRQGTVPAADLEPMAGVSWYRVRSGELTGWVYGTFVREI